MVRPVVVESAVRSLVEGRSVKDTQAEASGRRRLGLAVGELHMLAELRTAALDDIAAAVAVAVLHIHLRNLVMPDLARHVSTSLSTQVPPRSADPAHRIPQTSHCLLRSVGRRSAAQFSLNSDFDA